MTHFVEFNAYNINKEELGKKFIQLCKMPNLIEIYSNGRELHNKWLTKWYEKPSLDNLRNLMNGYAYSNEKPTEENYYFLLYRDNTLDESINKIEDNYINIYRFYVLSGLSIRLKNDEYIFNNNIKDFIALPYSIYTKNQVKNDSDIIKNVWYIFTQIGHQYFVP